MKEKRIMRENRHDLRIPEVEIVVHAAQGDLGVISFWWGSDIHGEAEVTCAVSDPSAAKIVASLLREAATILVSADWITLDELDTRSREDERGEPF